MSELYSGNHAAFPPSPAQTFVDKDGHDITTTVTAYDTEAFDQFVRMMSIRHRVVVIDIGEVLEAVRAMFEQRGVPDDDEPEHDHNFGASFIPGNTTKH